MVSVVGGYIYGLLHSINSWAICDPLSLGNQRPKDVYNIYKQNLSWIQQGEKLNAMEINISGLTSMDNKIRKRN